MNREIKFRAWDEKFKVMLPQVAVFDNENICIPDVTVNELYKGDALEERMNDLSGDVPEWYLMTTGFILMQCTGITDMAEKEIWEGDIIQCYYGGSKNGAIEVVEFKDGAFILRHRAIPVITYMEFDDVYTSDVEIIGNVFENPELLTH